MCITEKSQIVRHILRYLIEHRDAQDTLEGIVEWWLVEQRIRQQTARVQDALDDLVKQNFVLVQTDNDARTRYRLNYREVNQISEFIRSSQELTEQS